MSDNGPSNYTDYVDLSLFTVLIQWLIIVLWTKSSLFNNRNTLIFLNCVLFVFMLLKTTHPQINPQKAFMWLFTILPMCFFHNFEIRTHNRHFWAYLVQHSWNKTISCILHSLSSSIFCFIFLCKRVPTQCVCNNLNGTPAYSQSWK